MKLDQTKPLASPGQNGGAASPQPSTLPLQSSDPPHTKDLPDGVCLWLLKNAEGFARGQIQRYCWRGAKGGVLPGGFDANSIAAQTVADLLQAREARTEE